MKRSNDIRDDAIHGNSEIMAVVLVELMTMALQVLFDMVHEMIDFAFRCKYLVGRHIVIVNDVGEEITFISDSVDVVDDGFFDPGWVIVSGLEGVSGDGGCRCCEAGEGEGGGEAHFGGWFGTRFGWRLDVGVCQVTNEEINNILYKHSTN